MKIVKKTSIIISALLTVTMVLPIAANAKNSYPQFPKMISGEEIYTITDEARAERVAMLDAAKKEVCRAYHNGEYDWDFDLDGDIDIYDAHHIMKRYIEHSIDEEKEDYLMNFWDEKNGVLIRERVPFTSEMRDKVDEEGDIDGNGFINAADSAYMLTAIFSDKQQGDVNTDGMVDARDASKMLAFYSANSVNIESDYVTEKNMEYLGDLNGDGKVDSADASYALAEYSKSATE